MTADIPTGGYFTDESKQCHQTTKDLQLRDLQSKKTLLRLVLTDLYSTIVRDYYQALQFAKSTNSSSISLMLNSAALRQNLNKRKTFWIRKEQVSLEKNLDGCQKPYTH